MENIIDVENSKKTDNSSASFFGKIVNIESSRLKSSKFSYVTLREWLMGQFKNDELFTLFANMDSAMRYIHSKGFCICSFNPKDIEILNDSLNQIKFNLLMKMPEGLAERKKIVREDIGRLSFLQIGIYSRCLNYLNPDFLRQHFSEFAMFLPEDTVPYYRGIIERGASVYLGDYLSEKRRRDLVALEKEVGGATGDFADGKKLVKGGSLFSENDSMNTKVNDSIYKSLNSISDAAYISFLMIPVLVVTLGIILSIFALLS